MSITTIYDYDKKEVTTIEEKDGKKTQVNKNLELNDKLPDIVKAKLEAKK